MSSTAPRVSTTPEQQAHNEWVKQQIAALSGDVETTRSRLAGVDSAATAAAIQASKVGVDQIPLNDRVLSTDSNNRLARPILDGDYWTDVQNGRKLVWQIPSVANPGAFESSIWRNVTWNSSGGFIFQPNAMEGAELHITPILTIPSSL